MSDYFCVVATLKSEGTAISKEFLAVPKNWIKNNNILYWPNTNSKILIKDNSSEPHYETWKSSKCYIHTEFIASYEEALMWQEKFTEIYKEDTKKMLLKKHEHNSNTEFGHSSSFTEATNNTSEQVEQSIPKLVESTIEHDKEIVANTKCNCILNQKSTQNALKKINDELISIKLILARMEKANNSRPIDSITNVPNNNIEELSDLFEFPINSIVKLKEFDVAVKDQNYVSFLKIKFGAYCGTTGTEMNSNKIAAKLASEVMFSKGLLATASWTGISRTQNVAEKLPFRTLTGVLNLFNHIMRNCDNRWTVANTYTLFREKLLKHAKKRNDAYNKKLSFINSINTESEVDMDINIVKEEVMIE